MSLGVSKEVKVVRENQSILSPFPNNVQEFSLKDTYSNFKQKSNGVDAAGIYAYYSLVSNAEKGFTEVRLYIEKTQPDAKEYLKTLCLLPHQ